MPGFPDRAIKVETGKRYFAMTCVCVGCGTEVKDKEGKPVEKLYDQVVDIKSGLQSVKPQCPMMKPQCSMMKPQCLMMKPQCPIVMKPQCLIMMKPQCLMMKPQSVKSVA